MNILYVILLAVLGGLLYRLGGIGKPFNTKYRDIGIPLLIIVFAIIASKLHWSLIFSVGLLFASLTTYNKWVGYFFNRPDKHTVYLESWIVTGLLYGLSVLPYIFFVTRDYIVFSISCLLLAIVTGIWSIFIGKAWLEEGGRGFILTFYYLICIYKNEIIESIKKIFSS